MQRHIKRYLSLIIFSAVIAILSFSIYSISWTKKDQILASSDNNLDAVIEKYILNHPETIIKSVDNLQKKNLSIAQSRRQEYIKSKAAELKNSGLMPIFGNKDGKKVITFFYDYSCGYCKKSDTVIKQFILRNPDTKVIYKPYPVMGEASMYLSKAVLAFAKTTDAEQAKKFHNDLVNLKKITKESVKKAAEARGVKYNKLEEAMDSKQVQQELNKIIELGVALDIKAVPSFIIKNELHQGYRNLDELKKISW